MTMAHDPTRHWPLGVGPKNTSIPGAAWLELLNGQAFPVVGAGAMVWNGTMWVPVSDQDRLPVEAALSGSKPEVESAQYEEGEGMVETYARAEGADVIEVYVETGYVRVRTDGQAATATTGEPLGAGFAAAWAVPSISVYYAQESVITVVSR